MFNNDDFLDTLLGTVAFAGMFLFGRSSGKHEAYVEFDKKNKENEIEKLKDEIKELKKRIPKVSDEYPYKYY